MIAKLRYFISLLMPLKLKWYLIRTLPNIVYFAGKFFQGLDYTWQRDTVFYDLYCDIKYRILLDPKRAHTLYLCAKNCVSIDGDYAELGVYRGAGSKLIIEASQHNKRMHLFDTFEGLPEVNLENDPYWKEGDMSETSLEEVQSFLNCENALFYKGFFPASAAEVQCSAYAFVHIDVDIYQSVKDACIYFYSKMTPGGMMLFDDYAFLSCPGVKKAVDNFFSDKPETPVVIGTGQCLVVKQ